MIIKDTIFFSHIEYRKKKKTEIENLNIHRRYCSYQILVKVLHRCNSKFATKIR